MGPLGGQLAFLDRSARPTIAELAEPELRLGGTRINPRTNGPSRASFFTGIRIGSVDGGGERAVQTPPDARISYVQWSPDGSRLAFANTTEGGIELWVADTATGAAQRIVGPELNAALGSPYQWASDGRSLLVRTVVAGRGPEPTVGVVTGPVIQESEGDSNPVRTYQDLLQTPHDEPLFEYYFTSRLARVPADGGATTPIGEPAIIASFDPSPSGDYLLIRRIKRPFSYIVPLSRFANDTVVLDSAGQVVYPAHDEPEVTFAPIGRDMVNPGSRSIAWATSK